MSSPPLTSTQSDDNVKSSKLQKPLCRSAWWVLFLLATYTMSLWFQTFKAFTRTPSVAHGLLWLGVMAFLLLLLTILAYDSYVQEKVKGRVQKSLPPFDWLIERRFLLPSGSFVRRPWPISRELQPGQQRERQEDAI